MNTICVPLCLAFYIQHNYCGGLNNVVLCLLKRPCLSLFSNLILSSFPWGILMAPVSGTSGCAYVCSPGGEGLTVAAQMEWAGNGSSCKSMMSQMPNRPELTAKEIFPRMVRLEGGMQ